MRQVGCALRAQAPNQKRSDAVRTVILSQRRQGTKHEQTAIVLISRQAQPAGLSCEF